VGRKKEAEAVDQPPRQPQKEKIIQRFEQGHTTTLNK
jgi:hypothetical protein